MHHQRESGQALLTTIVGISLVLLVLMTTVTVTLYSNRVIARRLTYQGQALNAAEAGIVEGLSWFRRQPPPVATFNPQLNLTAIPPVDDTEDPSIGIVRTFDVSRQARLKGRYEVPRGNAGAGTGVFDVTSQVNKSGTGTVWQLESTGYIYVENDPSKAFNQAPNAILSKQTVRSQIERLTVSLPEGGAGLFTGKNAKVTIGAQARIKGGSNGIGFANASTGRPISIANAAVTVTGTPARRGNSTAAYDFKNVFNVTQQELLALADIQATRMTDLPRPMPSMSLVVFKGNAAFDAATPLTGSGIFVVLGDLSVTGASNSDFNGLIYVTGNFTMDQPSIVSGAVIVANGTATGDVSVGNGAGSDVAEIDYDPSMLTQINQQMAAYRYSRTMYWVGK
jgi:hypothetical protein